MTKLVLSWKGNKTVYFLNKREKSNEISTGAEKALKTF